MKPIEQARAEMEADRSDFIKKTGPILAAGMKLKKVMLDKKITNAKAKCPVCEHGFIHGRLAGRKNHLRMWCDGEGCDVQMME